MRHRILMGEQYLDCTCPSCHDDNSKMRDESLFMGMHTSDAARDRMQLMYSCLMDDIAKPSMKVRAGEEMVDMCVKGGLVGEELAFV